MARLKLKPNKDKPLRQRHPWVFSGAIAHTRGQPSSEKQVEIVDSKGHWLAFADFSLRSQIRARATSWHHSELPDTAYWRSLLEASIQRRNQLLPTTEARRLVFAESDSIPGLIVDQYDNTLVMQALTAPADARKGEMIAALSDILSPDAIVERDDPMRRKEGLAPADGVVWGALPDHPLIITENEHQFYVDLQAGQKTGFYLDQAENRAALAPYCAGAEVLNAFCYTGAFSVYALAAGAGHVTNIDSSEHALNLAARNMELNGFQSQQWTPVQADVFKQLRLWRDEGRLFDLIILDPPKFANNRRQIDRAARGYKDINWLAMRLLRPGGLLATFSCSGLISRDLFQKIVFGAALDAGRDVRILRHFSQAADHPVLLTFPEGAYLKGLLCHVN
ncbi:MAG: methyltransferase domain-containing protein [Chloroflexi bacterium]|nr:methyltransferase domain-containing protein [Chloroflexota bacterium]